MGYRHINNLYKDQGVLMFKECFATEKIHGTSGHIRFLPQSLSDPGGRLEIFPGGETLDRATGVIEKVVPRESLLERLRALGATKEVVVHGEFYGGSQQKMSGTYGKELKFIVFEVCIDDMWLNVPAAEDVVKKLGFEFVHYKQIPTTMEAIDAERDADSVQAIRNGMGEGHHREGVVLRPLIEVTKNNGERIAAKHKREEFGETKTPRVVDEARLAVLQGANAIAEEWVTENRLTHVLDKFPNADITQTGAVIKAMAEDVQRESAGEVVWSKEAMTAVGKKTALMFKARLAAVLYQGEPKG